MYSSKAQASSIDREPLTETVRSVGQLFGVDGIEIDIKPGNTWQTARHNDRIIVSGNPHGVIENIPLSQPEILHTIAHEIGHAVDILAQDRTPIKTASDRFFWNVLDDMVIDSRLNNAPAFDRTRPGLYAKLFPKGDHEKDQKHIQLMHALLLSELHPEAEHTYDPHIEAIVESIRSGSVDYDGKPFNPLRTMISLRTPLTLRRLIGRVYIKPHYDSLLRQDKAKASEDTSADTPAHSNGEAEDAYSTYDEKRHGIQSDTDTENSDMAQDASNENDSNSQSGQQNSADDTPSDGHADSHSSQETNPALQIANALKDALLDAQDSTKPQESAPQENKSDKSIKSRLAGYIQEEMDLSEYDAERYISSLNAHSAEIVALSDIFLLLTSKAETHQSPRFDLRADYEGKRLHPLHLGKAALQYTRRKNYPIWQPIVRRGSRIERSFGGLDISFVGDVSISMEGDNARAASASAQIIVEGLELATERAKKESGHHARPDVRAQIIAFGSSHVVLSPLGFDTSPVDKGRMFTHLLSPTGRGTHINASLQDIAQQAQQNPQRDHLAFVITDGDFHDHDKASHTVQKMAENCTVIQINIGDGADAIAERSLTIQEASELPEKLYEIIAAYSEDVLGPR